jgi:hypothetical protein
MAQLGARARVAPARRATLHALTWDPGTRHLPTAASDLRRARTTTHHDRRGFRPDATQVKPANSEHTMPWDSVAPHR